MVNIVIIRIITAHNLKRVKGERVSAMVIDCFESREGKEQNCLPNRHERARLSNDSSQGVKEKSFHGMVI
jgi:hypothetical protein